MYEYAYIGLPGEKKLRISEISCDSTYDSTRQSTGVSTCERTSVSTDFGGEVEEIDGHECDIVAYRSEGLGGSEGLFRGDGFSTSEGLVNDSLNDISVGNNNDNDSVDIQRDLMSSKENEINEILKLSDEYENMIDRLNKEILALHNDHKQLIIKNKKQINDEKMSNNLNYDDKLLLDIKKYNEKIMSEKMKLLRKKELELRKVLTYSYLYVYTCMCMDICIYLFMCID
jgi:hypothetical protein